MSRTRQISFTILQITLVLQILLQIPALAQGSTATGGLALHDVVSSTLANNFTIRRYADEVRVREAELEIARGAFDLSLDLSVSRSRNSTLHTLAEREALHLATSQAGYTTYRLGAARAFRSGVVVAPALELTRQDALTFDVPPLVQTRASLAVAYPLLRGFGRSIEAAALDAAEITLEAGELELRDVRAGSVYRAAAAYWTYRGAHESLGILRDAEENARRMLEETRALVDAGERPSSDLDQLRADLADRYAARTRAEQTLFEARQQLGLEMGLSPGEAARLPIPTTVFPSAIDLPERDLVATALSHRSDLQGARQAAAAAAIIVKAGRKAVLPKVDVRFDLGYAGLSEGNLPFLQHLPPYGQNDVGGGSASISLVLDFPPANHAARGALARQEAKLRQERLAVVELERSIASSILVTSGQLRSSSLELAKANEAVHLYLSAVTNERKKLQLGMSTQFDLLFVEERLRNAMLAQVAARVRYAQALARTRFETGTLLTSSIGEAVVRLVTPVDSTK